jgi:S1-C subfamily serine protease
MTSYDRYPPRYPWIAYLWPWLLVLALGAVLVWRFWPGKSSNGEDRSAEPRPVTPRGELDDEKTTIEIFRRASPSVVYITTLAVRQDPIGLDVYEVPRGTGSGFIWDEEGRIVTNYHVLRGANKAG